MKMTEFLHTAYLNAPGAAGIYFVKLRPPSRQATPKLIVR
jgi:hypothetical protein